jgi:hypothetical protein
MPEKIDALSTIPVLLRSRTKRVMAYLPGDFASNTAPQGLSKELLIEIHGCTGAKDIYKHDILVACMGMT